MSATSARPRGMPVALAIVLLIVVAGAGFAAGWLLRPEPAREAEEVARELGALLDRDHPLLDQDDDAREVAALYAEDARGVDAPSGDYATGRDGIAGGWQFMFAQGGTFRTEHALGNDRWAVLVTTWSVVGDDGSSISTPMVLLLEVRDGLIVSELDIYDAASALF